MSQVIAAAIGAVAALAGAWLKGFVDVRKLKAEHARQDHNHRQAYYHELAVSEDKLRELAFHTAPDDAAGVGQVIEGHFKQQVKGVRTFGTSAAREAAQALEEAYEAMDEEAMKDSAARLEAAAQADVAPER